MKPHTQNNLLFSAQSLCRKMRLIHEDHLFKSVWVSAQLHGIDYTNGPTYEDELAALEHYVKKALEEP